MRSSHAKEGAHPPSACTIDRLDSLPRLVVSLTKANRLLGKGIIPP
jgi:hypothetical protein